MADANNKLNTILKQLKDWTISDISNWNKEESNDYNTNYDIVDKDYNIILSNRRQSCFSQFFCKDYDDEEIGFKQDGRKMLVYALSQDVSNTEEEILFFISNIKSLGYSFNFKILEDYDLNSKSLDNELNYPNNENTNDNGDCDCYDEDDCDCYNYSYNYDNRAIPCFKNQRVYMMEIPFDKHKDLTTVKILAYFFRSLYEYDHYQMIRWFMEYKKRFPQYSIISIWPLFEYKMRMCGLRNHNLGHSLFYNPCKITLAEFKKIVEHEQKTNVYDNRNLENIMRSIPYPSISYNGRWGSSIAKLSKTLDLNESITDYFKKAENIQDLKTINEIYEGGDNKENIKFIYLYGWYGGQQPYERQY